jgi:hypothetical protein
VISKLHKFAVITITTRKRRQKKSAFIGFLKVRAEKQNHHHHQDDK